MKVSGKIIKRLVGILSTGVALCLLISSGLILTRVVPLYKAADNIKFKIVRNCDVNFTKTPSSNNVDQFGEKNMTSEGNKTLSKILLDAEKIVEDAIDVGDIIMRRKRKVIESTQLINEICLDEWSRLIGLAVAGIVLSVGHICTGHCGSFTTREQEDEGHRSSLPAILILIRLVLANGLWLVLGLSLYSSRCDLGDLRTERNVFSIFVAMEAAILSLLSYVKISLKRTRRNYRYKLEGNDEEDIENCAASFQQLSELEAADVHT